MGTILVTGGAGFIGGTFVRQWLAEEEADVVNLDALTYAGNLDSLESIATNPKHVFVHGNIRDLPLVAHLLSEYCPRAVVHCAAESHVDRSIDGPGEFLRTNTVGTFCLLEAVREYWNRLPAERRDAFRFLHISTDEVYGSLGSDGRFTEAASYAPRSPYAATKAAADHLVRAYHHTYGLPTLITNCSNNYGPYQFPEKLVPVMILNALEGERLPVYGDGTNIRDWLFVDDHCRALRLVLERGKPGETYNIGGDCELANIKMVRAICTTIDRRSPGLPHAPCESLITFVKDRPAHDRRYAIDAGKIRRELGWLPQQNLATGLELTVAWYMDNRKWVERVSSGAYRKRLGLGREAASHEP